MSSPPPPLAPTTPYSTEIVIVNSELPSFRQYSPPPPPPPPRPFSPELGLTRSASDTSSIDELNRQHSYSTVLESAQANASVSR